MKAAIKIFLVLSLVQCLWTLSIPEGDDDFVIKIFVPTPAPIPEDLKNAMLNSIVADDNPATLEDLDNISPDPIDETTTEQPTTDAPENLDETEEVCTCCPVIPAFVNDDSSKINAVKEQLKAGLAKLDEEFNAKKKELQEKLKKLEDEAAPLKIKLREVRKANRDKEEELKIEEMTEKSLELRKEFKAALDKLSELSESRLEAKGEYNEVARACRTSKGAEDYDEDTCKTELSEKIEAINSANSEISSAIKEIKDKDEEIVSVELSLKNAQEELWTTIYENRESIKDDISKMDEIYGKAPQIQEELEALGAQYERDQRKLNQKVRNELKEFNKMPFKWIPWTESKKYGPKNSVVGGYDLDLVDFLVIRREKFEGYDYGKYAAARGHAYTVKPSSEYAVTEFDILVGSDAVWCPLSDISVDYNEEFPICRHKHTASIVPGNLLQSGKCRIGFGYDAYVYDDEIEVLKYEKC